MQGLVRMFSSPATSPQVNRINSQILLKYSDIQQLESTGYQIYEFLRMKTQFNVGNTDVILCTSSQPEFIQETDDGAFLYGIDLQFITDEVE